MPDCIFCRIVEGEIPSRRIWEDDAAVAFLDVAPFKAGHTLVVPRQHVSDALEDADVLASIAPAIVAVGNLLRDKLDADGMNILSNVGEVAGQSVHHLHVHLVPRFADDAGMMALLTKDETIDADAVWEKLRPAQ